MTVPLRRSSFVDEAYRAIKQRIVGGDFPPGRALNIDALARQMGISNSPIREALRRLENERWVQTVPFRGAYVRAHDPAEVADVYELRQMLELAALAKAMARRPMPSMEGLHAALEDIQAAIRSGDAMGYLAADTRYHQALVDTAGNRRLSEIYATLVEQGRCFMLGRGPESMARMRKGRDQHGPIYQAILAGKSTQAMRLLKAHLQVTLEEVKPRPQKQRT